MGCSKSSKPHPDFRFVARLIFKIKTEITISFSNFIKSGSMLP